MSPVTVHCANQSLLGRNNNVSGALDEQTRDLRYSLDNNHCNGVVEVAKGQLQLP